MTILQTLNASGGGGGYRFTAGQLASYLRLSEDGYVSGTADFDTAREYLSRVRQTAQVTVVDNKQESAVLQLTSHLVFAPIVIDIDSGQLAVIVNAPLASIARINVSGGADAVVDRDYLRGFDYQLLADGGGLDFAGSYLRAALVSGGSITATIIVNDRLPGGGVYPDSPAASAYLTLAALEEMAASLPGDDVILISAGVAAVISVSASGGGGDYDYSVAVNDGSVAFSADGVLTLSSDVALTMIATAIVDDRYTITPPVTLIATARVFDIALSAAQSNRTLTTFAGVGDALVTLHPAGGISPYRLSLLSSANVALTNSSVVVLAATLTAAGDMVISAEVVDGSPLALRATTAFTITAIDPPPLSLSVAVNSEVLDGLPMTLASVSVSGGLLNEGSDYRLSAFGDAFGFIGGGILTMLAPNAGSITLTIYADDDHPNTRRVTSVIVGFVIDRSTLLPPSVVIARQLWNVRVGDVAFAATLTAAGGFAPYQLALLGEGAVGSSPDLTPGFALGDIENNVAVLSLLPPSVLESVGTLNAILQVADVVNGISRITLSLVVDVPTLRAEVFLFGGQGFSGDSNINAQPTVFAASADNLSLWLPVAVVPEMALIHHRATQINGTLVVIGGFLRGGQLRSRVLWSADRGRNWQQYNAPFSPRRDIGLAVHSGALWVMGGFDGALDNELWRSRDIGGGADSWQPQIDNESPIADALTGHNLISYRGTLMIPDGRNIDNAPRGWFYADNGDWRVLQQPAVPNLPRRGEVVIADDKLWMFGLEGRANNVYSYSGGDYASDWSSCANLAVTVGEYSSGFAINGTTHIFGGGSRQIRRLDGCPPNIPADTGFNVRAVYMPLPVNITLPPPTMQIVFVPLPVARLRGEVVLGFISISGGDAPNGYRLRAFAEDAVVGINANNELTMFAAGLTTFAATVVADDQHPSTEYATVILTARVIDAAVLSAPSAITIPAGLAATGTLATLRAAGGGGNFRYDLTGAPDYVRISEEGLLIMRGTSSADATTLAMTAQARGAFARNASFAAAEEIALAQILFA